MGCKEQSPAALCTDATTAAAATASAAVAAACGGNGVERRLAWQQLCVWASVPPVGRSVCGGHAAAARDRDVWRPGSRRRRVLPASGRQYRCLTGRTRPVLLPVATSAASATSGYRRRARRAGNRRRTDLRAAELGPQSGHGDRRSLALQLRARSGEYRGNGRTSRKTNIDLASSCVNKAFRICCDVFQQSIFANGSASTNENKCKTIEWRGTHTIPCGVWP